MKQEKTRSLSVSQVGGIASTNTQAVNITCENTTLKLSDDGATVAIMNAKIDIQRSPSIIAQLVVALSNSNGPIPPPDIDEFEDNFDPYDLDIKLNHNSVIKYRQLIEQLGEFHQLVESGYKVVSESKNSARQSIYKAINLHYRDLVGDLLLQMKDSNLSKIEIVRNNADKIIEGCIKYIATKCKESSELDQLTSEDIDIHSRYIALHAFSECEILEKPQ